MRVRDIINKFNKELDLLLGQNLKNEEDKRYAQDNPKLHPLIIVWSDLKLKQIKQLIDGIKILDAPITEEAFQPIIKFMAELSEEQLDEACYALNPHIRINQMMVFIAQTLSERLIPTSNDFLFPHLSKEEHAHIIKLKPHEFVLGETGMPIIIYECVENMLRRDMTPRHTFDINKTLTPIEIELIKRNCIFTENFFLIIAQKLKTQRTDREAINRLNEEAEKYLRLLDQSLKSCFHRQENINYIPNIHNGCGKYGWQRLSRRVFASIKNLNQLLDIMTTLIPDKRLFPNGECGCRTSCVHENRWDYFFMEASADMLKYLIQRIDVSEDLSKSAAFLFIMGKDYLSPNIRDFQKGLPDHYFSLKALVEFFLKQPSDEWEKDLAQISENTLSILLLGKSAPERDTLATKSLDANLFIQGRTDDYNKVVQLFFVELYRRMMINMPHSHGSIAGSTADTLKGALKFFGSFVSSVGETVFSVNDRDSKIAAVEQVIIPCLCNIDYSAKPADITRFMQDKNLTHHAPAIFGSALVNNAWSRMVVNQNLLSTLATLYDKYSDNTFYLRSSVVQTIQPSNPPPSQPINPASDEVNKNWGLGAYALRFK